MAHEVNAGEGTILVVDDESINRILLATNLGESGYAVETAEDGEQALRLLRARPFDAVLLDLIMPRMDGYEVLARMKADEELRRIPVIVISSAEEVESIVRCVEMGATDYLTKPFNPVLLHARLAASLTSLQQERMVILRQQLAHVTAAQEEERQRIAQELHDGVGPAMASVHLGLHTVHKLLDQEGHPAAEKLRDLAELTQASIRDIRRLIYDLRPVALDELGLVPALRQHLNRCQQEHGLTIEFSTHEEERLPAQVETALFRIVQEAVNNIVQHAQARRVDVTLRQGDGSVTLCVADDGQGFDPHTPRSGRHLGLWSMRERVEQLGGQLEVRSAPGQGTTVTTVVPL